ncbi:hypothetical protein FACS1894132_04820 [Clostridia bacterium]|nr:hypothetical protein FACS1894132_04820 [Clostridia bacterium]
METNEIMVTDEVIETTEEIVKAGSGKSFKIAAGVGLAVVMGVIAYKHIAKPIWTKIKTKKEQQNNGIIDADFREINEDISEEEIE